MVSNRIHTDFSSGDNPMFILQLDRVGQKVLGFTLRTPDGQSLVFKTMEQVMEVVAHVDPDQLAWHSLNCAMNFWDSDMSLPFWGISTGREVRFWDWVEGKAKTQAITRRRF